MFIYGQRSSLNLRRYVCFSQSRGCYLRKGALSQVDKLTTGNRGNIADLSNLALPQRASEDSLCSVNILYIQPYYICRRPCEGQGSDSPPSPLQCPTARSPPFPLGVLDSSSSLSGPPTRNSPSVACCPDLLAVCSCVVILCSEHVSSLRARTTCVSSLPSKVPSPRWG